MFCFYFKHKSAAIFMAAFTLITGITGILMYTGRLHKIKLNFEEDYLYFSIFHLIASIIIISGLIWEEPILILLYEGLHLATLTAFLTYTVVYIPVGRTFAVIIVSSCFVVYCIFNVYLYQEEMKLKKKFQMGKIYFSEIIYFRNNNIQ
ncbi:unnamed protein product [Psylliodes chrysocephalus]|uniref:Uncharacterized protein n=1 Tax=Psylliodes chrysocephalus TaxID=3402493 RepID=A0A9P0CR07_9CUCU|nr:unnamed protein product [Psylliodes chrysocephala]